MELYLAVIQQLHALQREKENENDESAKYSPLDMIGNMILLSDLMNEAIKFTAA